MPRDPREPLPRPSGSAPTERTERPTPSGEELRAARRARVRRIRRRVATAAVVSFLAAWGVVYAQMRLGDDPALGTGSTVAQVDSHASSTAPSSGSPPESAPSSGHGTASSDDSSTMVTAQS